ncbi:MAG: hypothetical protein ACI38T_00065, partial [Collinsella sp.]
MSRLISLRKKEVKRVLELCQDYDDRDSWRSIIMANIDESGYFGPWMQGLYITAGLPHAKSITRDLSRAKAEDPPMIWESELSRYATERAGSEIAIVSGTLKRDLVKIVERALHDMPNDGVEKVTQRIFRDFGELLPWQCRRIAQTETMIGMAEAGRAAAETLDVAFTKQWAISGLGNTRDSHVAMDGVIVDGNEYFELASCRMLYPHDTSIDPPAEEIINCACDVIRRPKMKSPNQTQEYSFSLPQNA